LRHAPSGLRRASETSVHDVKADAAQRRMLEGFRNGSDDAKSERLPKPHGNAVRLRNRVELHRGVSLLTSPGERVLAERAPHPPAPRIAGDHEARRGDVRARAGTVGAHMSRPKHAWAVAGHDRVAGRSFYPHVPCLLGRPSGVVSESLTGGDDLPEDGPDGRPVSVDVFANPHRSILTESLNQGRIFFEPPSGKCEGADARRRWPGLWCPEHIVA